jgi:hypothetical protein
MKLKHLVILGVLVFLNGFIFTVLLLMVSREMARPAATPTQLSTATPTVEPTHTVTPPVSIPTSTPLATSTTAPQPTATNTTVIVQPSPTQTSVPAVPTATFTPGGPTATSVAPTATNTAGAPTATSAPPTTTATTQPTATQAPAWDFDYVENSMLTVGNCGGPNFSGVILGEGGARTNGISVRFWFYTVEDCKVSGQDKPVGEWGFDPALEPALRDTHIEFYLQVVDNCTNLAPRSERFTIVFDNACQAGQFDNITFRYTR